MDRFKVWLRPLGSSFRVKVDGNDNAKWLSRRLQDQEVECTQLENNGCTAYWMFVATSPSPMPRLNLQETIAGMQEVQLMLEPT